MDFEIVTIQTSGDRFASLPPKEVLERSGKGIFIKELEEALLSGRVDLAVHSLKDMPAEAAPGLVLTGYQKREDPRDALVAKGGGKLEELPEGARIGTSSLRRQLQISEMPGMREKNFQFTALRGNVDTRVRKVKEGEVDAIVLSLAGLARLGLEREASQVFDPVSEMVPPCGQGTLVAEIRDNRKDLAQILHTAEETKTLAASAVERLALRALGGGCLEAIGIYCVPLEKGELELHLYRHNGEDLNSPGDRASWKLKGEDAGNLLSKLAAKN